MQLGGVVTGGFDLRVHALAQRLGAACIERFVNEGEGGGFAPVRAAEGLNGADDDPAHRDGCGKAGQPEDGAPPDLTLQALFQPHGPDNQTGRGLFPRLGVKAQRIHGAQGRHDLGRRCGIAGKEVLNLDAPGVIKLAVHVGLKFDLGNRVCLRSVSLNHGNP